MKLQEKKASLIEVGEMLNRKELAKVLNVSVRTIDRYRQQGMPYYKANWRGVIGFKLKEVKEWLKGE